MKDYINSSLIAKLKFVKESYIHFGTNRDFELKHKLIHRIDDQAVEKIVALLKGVSRSFSKKDKIYILRDHKSTKADLTALIREAGAKVTNDISKATLIMGNENQGTLRKSPLTNSSMSQIPASSYVYSSYSMSYSPRPLPKFEYEIRNDQHDWLDVQEGDSINIENGYIYNNDISSTYTAILRDHYDYSDIQADGTYLTNAGVIILYEILSRKIPIISEESVLSSTATNVMDLSTFNMLRDMLKAGEEDHETARKILFNCNIEKSYYWIVKLFQEAPRGLMFNRLTKSYKAFLDRLDRTKYIQGSYYINFKYTLSSMTTWELMKECIHRGIFSDETRVQLEKDLEKDVKFSVESVVSKYDDAIEFSYTIDYDKLIERVKAEH